MPKELRSFLIGISVIGTVVGFAAGDRRDPFSFTAAILTIAGLFALVMLFGWLSQPKGVPGGAARLAGRRNESIAAAGTVFQGPIIGAFTAGIEGQDGSFAPWLAMIFAAPELGPGFKPAATNASHFAFEIGRSAARGLVPRDEALRLSARESIRQFTFAADHGRALPPIMQDPDAHLPPTLARAATSSATTHRTEVEQEQVAKRVREWRLGSQVDRIFQEIESRTERFVEVLCRSPGIALFANEAFAGHVRENALPLVFGLIVVRRASGPRYFVLREWTQLVELVEQRMNHVGLSTIEMLGAAGKSYDDSVRERVKERVRGQIAWLQTVLFGFVSQQRLTGTQHERATAVIRWYLAAMGLGDDAAHESDIAAEASILADEILKAREPT